jgi:hypothetical protein
MKSQFDDPLPLSADRRTITAKGPLEWASGDAQHCRISVVITQGNLRGTGDTGNYNDDDQTWDCDVRVDSPHNGQWQVGEVHCVGTITMSGPPPPDAWPAQDVSLQLQQAAAPA